MAQWTNANRINGFLNATPLPLFCEISGAMLVALVGLTAGWQAVRRNTCKFRNLQNSLQIKISEFSLRFTEVQHCYSSNNAIKVDFSAKACSKVGFGGAKNSGSRMISGRSLLFFLLLSTTVPGAHKIQRLNLPILCILGWELNKLFVS